MSDSKPSCFIIMPISTSDPVRYSGDRDHFRHVLEHLFIPAIQAAELNPIPPVAKGADIIHAEIIKHLESDEMVLCDMSSLNPNVFFELGIRTAVNKPIALVKDDLTDHVPFDTGIINHHTYLSSLAAWELDGEITRLKDHILKCVEGVEKGSTLWRYFSLSAQAKSLKAESGVGAQLEYLALQVEALREESKYQITFPTPVAIEEEIAEDILGLAARYVVSKDISLDIKNQQIIIEHDPDLPGDFVRAIESHRYDRFDYELIWRERKQIS